MYTHTQVIGSQVVLKQLHTDSMYLIEGKIKV